VIDLGLRAWAVQDGFDPLETLESVEIKYHQYEQCHKVISAPESIAELQQWQTQVDSYHTFSIAELQKLILPKHGMQSPTLEISHTLKLFV
jgi:hypothetical protein